MFSHTFSRNVLGAVLAASLLVPAAQADDWARDSGAALDPAIATAIRDRASLTPEPVVLDPAIASAMRDHASVAPEGAAIDPAIQAALLERASSITRPDDRAGARGVGSLPQPGQVAASEAFDWNIIGVGAGATFAALLLAFGSLIAVRHGRTRATNA
jgi:hypothetical protein